MFPESVQPRQYEEIAREDHEHRQRSRVDRVQKSNTKPKEHRVSRRLGDQALPEEPYNDGIERDEGVLSPGEVRVQNDGRIETTRERDPAGCAPRHFEMRLEHEMQGEEERAGQQSVDGDRRLVNRDWMAKEPEDGQQE